MSEVSFLVELLKERSHHEIAKISAYLLAPGLVLVLTISGIHGRPLALGLERPVTISELRTELAETGLPISKKGVALILEPVESEYRIQVGGGSSRIWSSLDEPTLRANANRLTMSQGGLNGKTPFLGVNGPVTVVIEGDLGKNIQVPGGVERVDDWRLPSRRSLSMLSSVLLACVFAFGMSLATGLPAARRNKDTAS